MMRKPIQIHTLIGPENAKWQGMMLVTALCDDGTIWQRVDGVVGGEVLSWEKLPDIPQDDRPTTPTPNEGGRG